MRCGSSNVNFRLPRSDWNELIFPSFFGGLRWATAYAVVVAFIWSATRKYSKLCYCHLFIFMPTHTSDNNFGLSRISSRCGSCIRAIWRSQCLCVIHITHEPITTYSATDAAATATNSSDVKQSNKLHTFAWIGRESYWNAVERRFREENGHRLDIKLQLCAEYIQFIIIWQ